MARGNTANLQTGRTRLAWLFLSPALLVLLTVGLYPLLWTFAMSLTDARLGSSREIRLVGLENYIELFSSSEFWGAVGHTLVFTGSSVSLELALGMIIALVVHSTFRGRGVVRAAMLVPWALPTVVAARLWSFIYVDTYGVMNDLLVTRTGILGQKLAWLAEPGLAMFSVVLADVWKTTPFAALLLLAGLQVIPQEIYAAAEIDGASRWQSFKSLTLPLLKPMILLVLIFRTLDALRVFDVIWVMTAGAVETESMATLNYRELIGFQKLGYGSAISVTIFFLIAAFVALYVRWIPLEEEG